MTVFIIIVCVIAVLSALYLFLIFPNTEARKRAPFFEGKKFFAHRGLFNNEDIPENSLVAFEKAASEGYGIELDTHITSDGVTVVFHDDTLDRMCGVSGSVESHTYEQLQSFRLLGTENGIPTFEQVLSVVNGRVPLIVEVKGTTTNTDVCKATAEILDKYDGEYCVESFNPFYVGWFAKNRKDVVRGQLSCKMRDGKKISIRMRDFALENLLMNFISRPDFIAYCHDDKNKISFRIARALGGYPVAWTVRSQEQIDGNEKAFKAFIFEKFIPR